MHFANYDAYIGRPRQSRASRRTFSTVSRAMPSSNGALLELKGKRLGCLCKPKMCRGDVIAEWLDREG
jgi:hypothetical protein